MPAAPTRSISGVVVLFITDESEIDLKTGISVLYFYTPQLIQHHKCLTHFETLEDELPSIKFYAIDINAFSKQIKRHNIKSLPFVRVFQDEGYAVKSFVEMNDILNKSILLDIEDRYSKGELRVKGRPRKKASGTATTIRSENIIEDLG